MKLPFCLSPSFIVISTPLLLNWMEEFNNLFNSNPIGPYPAMILLIGYTFTLSTQRPSYRRNITKLRTIKAITKKGDRDIYIGHSD